MIHNLKNSTIFGSIFEEKRKDCEPSEEEKEEQKVSKMYNQIAKGL